MSQASSSNKWNNKRERQYQHIRQSEQKRGVDEDRADKIAARTVNKELARHGESKQASRTSTIDIASSRRGGLRSHRGAARRTYALLYEEARRKGLHGRSKMNKAQLQRTLS